MIHMDIGLVVSTRFINAPFLQAQHASAARPRRTLGIRGDRTVRLPASVMHFLKQRHFKA
jgi:hypothetical protein